MKKKLFALAAFALLGAGTADATVFTGTAAFSNTDASGNRLGVTGPTSPVAFTTNSLSATSLFNNSQYFANFLTLNTTFNASGCLFGCTASDPLKLTFSFTSPTGGSSVQTGSATETVFSLAAIFDNGSIRWNGDTNFDIFLGSYATTTVNFSNGAQAAVDVFDAALSGGNTSQTASIGLRIRDLADGRTTAVPEPATWAMMVVGFGAAGFATRRRRTSVRFA